MIGIVFCVRSSSKRFLLDSAGTNRPLRNEEEWKKRFLGGRNAQRSGYGDLICSKPIPAIAEDLALLRDDVAQRIRPHFQAPSWSRVDLFCVPHLSQIQWKHLFSGGVSVNLQAWTGNTINEEIPLSPQFSVDYVCKMLAIPREVLVTRPVRISKALGARAGFSERVRAQSDSFFTDVVAR
jgi:hypothetical protein